MFEEYAYGCRACYDDRAGRLTIENQKIRKTMLIKGSRICTESVTDKITGTVWDAPADRLPWQQVPVFTPGEEVQVTFSAEACGEHPCLGEHLRACLWLSAGRAQVRYEFTLFPDIPFIAQQYFTAPGAVSRTSADSAGQNTVSGIEQAAPSSAAAVTPPDTLDAVPLGGRHHMDLQVCRLFDKTDANDCLLTHNTIPLYERGTPSFCGNVFRFDDRVSGCSLMLVKHAPTASSELCRPEADLTLRGTTAAVLHGCGIDFSQTYSEEIPAYASAVGVGPTDAMQDAFADWNRAHRAHALPRGTVIMSNTWGDRSQDAAVCEDFILRELAVAHTLGIEVLQIDDGWQSGTTANSKLKKGGVWEGYYADDPGFWTVHPDKFPHGLAPLSRRAASLGIALGLWFSPDSSSDFMNYERDIETLWQLYTDCGIRYFKLDGVKIRNKICEKRFIALMETLAQRSSGQICFNLDVTAEDRFGYLYGMRFGTLFVENRYTDFGNYYPHRTFRNLWTLSSLIPPQRLQMEFLNLRRNPQNYTDFPFAPALYGADYVFATVLPANPLAWMELTGLGEEDRNALQKIIGIRRKYAAELADAYVSPIGEIPDGTHFPGYMLRGAACVHLLFFREGTRDDTHRFPLYNLPDGMTPKVLYESAPAHVVLHPGEAAEAEVTLSEPRSFVWLRLGRSHV